MGEEAPLRRPPPMGRAPTKNRLKKAKSQGGSRHASSRKLSRGRSQGGSQGKSQGGKSQGGMRKQSSMRVHSQRESSASSGANTGASSKQLSIGDEAAAGRRRPKSSSRSASYKVKAGSVAPAGTATMERAMSSRSGRAAPPLDPNRKQLSRGLSARDNLKLKLGVKKVEGMEMAGEAADACELLGIKKKDLVRLKVRFDLGDDDRSGVMEQDEFFKVLDEDKTVFGTALFSLIDDDSSGTLSFEEYVKVLTTYCVFNKKDMLRFIFDVFDTDGSGNLDEDEFIAMCVQINATPFFPGNLQKAFGSFDTSGDGLIDFDEFIAIERKYPMLLFPAFHLQDVMQRRTLGQKRWTAILRHKAQHERIEAYKLAHDGELPPEALSKKRPCVCF